MDDALAVLAEAREKNEPVAIVGDYDVDGVSATALLSAVLRACGLRVEPVLPHRLKEGYGFQPVHVERAVELECRVVVTVDCGVSSHPAVEAALEAGLRVVITDHHLPKDPLPDGTIVVNPRLEGSTYPFPDLAGVGLAFKLAAAFATRCERPIKAAQLLRIACLGTIADLVPLVGENRVIAAIGLRELALTRSPGIRALIKVAGVKPPLTAADVGYRLGPRLNAAGRLDSPDQALELLLSRDERRAQELAQALDRHNRDRQAAEAKAVDEARELLIPADGEDPPAIAVAWSEGWHRGVVGIAAGRIARELHRPTLLLALEGDTATGSGRSISGVHLHDFLKTWDPELDRFGGHAQAIGMTVRADRLEDLKARWLEAAAAEWPAEVLRRRYRYEADLAPAQVDQGLLQELRRLEPFGQDNPQPLLKVGPLESLAPPRLFGKGHLSVLARGDDGGRVTLIGWGWGERQDEVQGRFEVLGRLHYDDYRKAPVLHLVDSRPA